MTEFFGQEVQVLEVGVPVGVMMDYAGVTAPAEWMLAEGQALAKADYPALFAVLGERYGSGDGSGSQFQLPNCKRRVSMHPDTGYALGAAGGDESITLVTAQMPAHDHGAAGAHSHSMAAAGVHSHGGGTGGAGGHGHNSNVNVIGYTGGGLGTVPFMRDIENPGVGVNGQRASIIHAVADHAHAIGADGSHSHSLGTEPAHTHTSEGGGSAHPNMQPYIVLNKIIKVS